MLKLGYRFVGVNNEISRYSEQNGCGNAYNYTHVCMYVTRIAKSIRLENKAWLIIEFKLS